MSNYNFLKLSSSAQVSALGGQNCSQFSDNPSLAFQNPALLRASMHKKMEAGFLLFPGGMQTYQAMGGVYLPALETTLGVGLHYLNYGSLDETDAAGLQLGSFRPMDYLLQVSASRSYGKHWNYGISLQFIQSSYGIYRSKAMAMDMGLSYADSANGWQMALVAKHMGMQLQNYEGSTNRELPFDVRWGISKKLQQAPWQFSLQLNRLHQWDLLYSDSTLPVGGLASSNKGWADAFFRHAILSAQLMAGDKIELSGGYNYLRRQELSTGNGGNGLSGFSLGVGVLLKKMQFRYARTNYQSNQVLHHIGIIIR